MLLATILGVLLTPALYRVIQGFSERFFGAASNKDAPTAPPAP